MQKKVTATIVAIIAAVASGGIALSFDFSQTETNISDDDTTIINQGDDEFCTLAQAACLEEIIPSEYEEVCPIINTICG